MKKWNALLLTGVLILMAAACGGSGGGTDNGPSTDDDTGTVPDPTAATLVFPDNNETCNEGTALDDTRSTVTFQWNASQNTDRYRLTLRNLNTGSTSNVDATGTQIDITINRGTPYEWFVTSRANGTNATAQSATWRFYNEGPGITNYARFPAEAVAPARGATLVGVTSVDLSWTGSDVDDDIVDYEVFLDTNTDPSTSVGTTTASNIDGVAVSAGNTYYWKVVTRDSQSNSSTSEIFQFRVD